MITYFFFGLLGLVFATLAKMESVKKDFKVANQTFVYRRFFEDELTAIAMSIVFLIIMAGSVSEWVNFNPLVKDYIRLLFACGGAIGSWAALLFLGKSKKFIRGVIDKKTDIADNKI